MSAATAGIAGALRRYPLLLLLVPMVIGFQAAAPQFLSPANVRGIALDSAVLAIVVVPGALLIICGHLDLSVGSTLALGAVVSAKLIVEYDVMAWQAVAGGVLAGAAVGAVNGVLCALLGLSPFIVTLGMLTAVRGLDLLLSPLPLNAFGDSFGALAGQVLGIPIPVLLAAAVLAAGAAFLTFSPGGRHVYAIGVNRQAAYLSGIQVRWVPFLLYVSSGAAAGLAGVVQAARLNSAPAGSLGVAFELTLLTAVLLGGVAFTGGSGSVLGVLLGVLFLGGLQNGLTLLDVPDASQQLAQGLALVAAAGFALVKVPALGQAVPAARSPSARGRADSPVAPTTAPPG